MDGGLRDCLRDLVFDHYDYYRQRFPHLNMPERDRVEDPLAWMTNNEILACLTDEEKDRAIASGSLSIEEESRIDCRAIIDRWMSQLEANMIEDIRNAPTKKDLARHVDGARSVLSVLGKLFMRHGELDTNGEGRAIAYGLECWDAFDYVRLAIGAEAAMSSLEVVDAIDYHLAACPEPTTEQRQTYARNKPQSSMRCFGIVPADPDEESTGRICERLESVLAPFAETGEADDINGPSVQLRDSQDCFLGFYHRFKSTGEAARRVAEALPGEAVHEVSDAGSSALGPKVRPGDSAGRGPGKHTPDGG